MSPQTSHEERGPFSLILVFVRFLNCPVRLHVKRPRRALSMGQTLKSMERLWMIFASAAMNRCKTWYIDLYQSEQRHGGGFFVVVDGSIIGQISFWWFFEKETAVKKKREKLQARSFIYSLGLPTGIVCENLTYFFAFVLFVCKYVHKIRGKTVKSLTGKLTAASSGILLAVQLHFKKGLNINLSFVLNLHI